jgi:hypothetical protein
MATPTINYVLAHIGYHQVRKKKTPHIHIQSNTSMHASELHNELSFTSKNQDKENRIP